PPVLRRILAELETRTGAAPAVARERVIALIMLLTASSADRARQLADGQRTDLDHDSFTTNLVDMLVGCLEATPGAPIAERAPSEGVGVAAVDG
ncbi:MAG: hypothetical protein KDB21_07590, partial [Acidimicrobiales bacterium]|nr:hypothetical protein [Acidimicrobiales bacterium]